MAHRSLEPIPDTVALLDNNYFFPLSLSSGEMRCKSKGHHTTVYFFALGQEIFNRVKIRSNFVRPSVCR